ncbi:aminotransferase class IV family protein [Hydrogenimonas thermophila]|uniref:aminotransferase class IV family protein n=1 Tax=Hydrogenimonas thermophila TaxID=223786 RepID=UPI002936F7C4|nr:aminotransferase class IV family protein [Hydrogenimonas thermophila]WOE70309.1 aminotransferase class IV family protein [Hydrogenimonas thermophila]WOE72826.1 aminotransferase class IV family protein [Hydrogenimonas thermophila]
MLVETISILDGKALHLGYHQERLNRSQKALFSSFTHISLDKIIKPPSSNRQLKCRVIYANGLVDVSYSTYNPRVVKNLKLIESNIDYSFKYSNREELNELFAQKGNADDILIVKNGLITDTSIANIAFWDGHKWITPKSPLLKGTTRERLLRNGFLIQRDIFIDEIEKFELFALMNAMIGFKPIKNGTIS